MLESRHYSAGFLLRECFFPLVFFVFLTLCAAFCERVCPGSKVSNRATAKLRLCHVVVNVSHNLPLTLCASPRVKPVQEPFSPQAPGDAFLRPSLLCLAAAFSSPMSTRGARPSGSLAGHPDGVLPLPKLSLCPFPMRKVQSHSNEHARPLSA